MTKFKTNDLLKIKHIDSGSTYFSDVCFIPNDCCYIATDMGRFYDDLMDDEHEYEIIAAWRYNEATGNYFLIFNEEGYGISMEEPCYDLENKDVKPVDVEYDKYRQVQCENEELKSIIVELNKKLYRKNFGE